MKSSIIVRWQQVLASAAAASSLLLLPHPARAQPPEIVPPKAVPPTPNGQLPLLPLKLEEWLKSRGGMTTLRLKMDNASGVAVAQAIQREAGLPIKVASGMGEGKELGPVFSVEATGQPFWEAIRQWNRGPQKLYLGPDWAGSDGNALLTLNTSTAMPEGRGLALGPLYLIASSASVSSSSERTVSIGAAGAAPKAPTARVQGSLRLQSSLFVDPKLSPDIAGLIAQVERAQDDQGREIAVHPIFGTPTAPGGTRGNEPIGLSFILDAPRPGAKTLKLRGVMRLAVVTKREKWEIDPSLAGPQQKKFAGEGGEVMLRFNRLNVDERHSTAFFRIERSGGRRAFASRGNAATFALGGFNDTLSAIRAFNAGDHALTTSGGNGNGGVDGGLDIEASFNLSGNNLDPEENTVTRMVVDLPLEWREVQIPFELKDLPLP